MGCPVHYKNLCRIRRPRPNLGQHIPLSECRKRCSIKMQYHQSSRPLTASVISCQHGVATVHIRSARYNNWLCSPPHFHISADARRAERYFCRTPKQNPGRQRRSGVLRVYGSRIASQRIFLLIRVFRSRLPLTRWIARMAPG